MDEEIERFQAKAEDGTVYTVISIQEYVEAGRHERIQGMKRLELDDGELVNYIDRSTFRIVATDEIIRRV